jgi:protein O-GlcNAc transferase
VTDSQAAQFERAIAHHRARQLGDAERVYREILAKDERYFDAVHMLGLLLHHREQSAAGLELLKRAETINANSADLQLNLAVVFSALSRGAEAAKHAIRAIELRPNDPDLVQPMALLLSRHKCAQAASAAWKLLTQIQPTAEAFSNWSVTLEWLGQYEQAGAACRRAIEINPNNALAYNNLGVYFERLGRIDESISAYRRAIALRPDHPDPHANLANVLQLDGKIDEAIESARRALAISPDHLTALRNLVGALQEKGQLDAAAQTCERCCRLLEQPATSEPAAGQTAARMRAINAALLPPIYESIEDIDRWRARLTENISRLAVENIRLDLAADPAPVLFSLAYQGRDDREIQQQYASLTIPPPDSSTSSTRKGAKIKVGLISRFFRGHTIGRLNQGLIENLSRDRFDVTVFSVGTSREEVALAIQKAADRYVALSISLPAARRAIGAEQLDILFYADLGMDPVTYSLAFSRLAPVQCVTWGHPVTSGIPGIDYFISSDLLEPSGAEGHYTEKLVRLANLAVCYHRPALGANHKTRADFGPPQDANLYGCLQMLQKFHPEFDEILAGILRRDPRGLLLLIHGINPHWDQLLMSRFSRTMSDVVDRIRFLDRMSYADFLALTNCCDVMLDPIHFGGGNTSYEAFAFGVPVVTLPSQFMRGRITAALYKMMGLKECVVDSAQVYIDVAARIGMQRSFRESLRAEIQQRNSVLYENRSGVRELEAFFESAVAKARGA